MGLHDLSWMQKREINEWAPFRRAINHSADSYLPRPHVHACASAFVCVHSGFGGFVLLLMFIILGLLVVFPLTGCLCDLIKNEKIQNLRNVQKLLQIYVLVVL